MAEADPSLTPEKRLLSLIEGTSAEEGNAPQAVAVQKESIFTKLAEMLSPEKMTAAVEEARTKLTALLKGEEYVSLNGVNKIVKVFTVGLGIYLLIGLIYEFAVADRRYLSGFEIMEQDVEAIPMSETRIFDTDLLRGAAEINVFIPPSKRIKEEVAEAKESQTSLQLVELIQDWKLAGISIFQESKDRTFCMIEDLKKNTTTFLRVGDSISGMKVSEINPDSIVLTFGEESIELR